MSMFETGFLGNRIAYALAALFLVACGSSENDGPLADAAVADEDGGVVAEPPLGAGHGEIALRVDGARRASRAGTVGNLHIALMLANGSGSAPASLNPALFSVKGSDGLYVTAGFDRAAWVEGEACNPAASVAADASASCTLTFALKDTAIPLELFYQTAGKMAGLGNDQRSATAAIALEPCTACGADCTYLDRDSAHCGACDAALEYGYGDDNARDITLECRSGEPTCPEDQGFTQCVGYIEEPGEVSLSEVVVCTDVSSSARNCGSCRARVEHGQCLNGVPTCAEGGAYSTCVAGDETFHCVDLRRDSAHCGTCGHSCDVSPAGKGFIDYQACGEDVPGQCSGLVAFSASEGDTLAEGDSCSKVCVANGFAGCNPEAFNCTELVDTSLNIGCSCVW
jgi:hypothetical protein